MNKNLFYKYWFYGTAVVLLVVAVYLIVQNLPAERRVGDPTGRVLNLGLSCVDHCSGYAESGDEWCFCDAPCPENGNCCADIATACPEIVG